VPTTNVRMLAQCLIIVAGFYLLCGAVFTLPFLAVGAGRIDPNAKKGSWGFRVLLVPGTVFLWPVMGWRWMTVIRASRHLVHPPRIAVRQGARQ